jgi:hypothetical protein
MASGLDAAWSDTIPKVIPASDEHTPHMYSI